MAVAVIHDAAKFEGPAITTAQITEKVVDSDMRECLLKRLYVFDDEAGRDSIVLNSQLKDLAFINITIKPLVSTSMIFITVTPENSTGFGRAKSVRLLDSTRSGDEVANEECLYDALYNHFTLHERYPEEALTSEVENEALISLINAVLDDSE